MKIFLTGAGGFLGKYIARDLLAQGHELTNFSRGSYPDLEEMGVTCIQGDIQDINSLTQAMAGHEACFHIASKVGMWGKAKDFYNINVLGTKNIVESCRVNNIQYLIYTSSPSVVFENHDLKGIDETHPYPKKFYGLYGKTKAEAEQYILNAHDQNLYTVSLRPHLIFGPGDQNLIPGVINAVKNKKLKIIGDGSNQVNVTYVENASLAHTLALEALMNNPKKVSGEAFFIGQGPVKLWDFINSVLEQVELPKLNSQISFKTAYNIGNLLEKFYSLIGRYNSDPPMTRFIALQLAKNHYYDHEKAHTLLNWKPNISIEEGLRKTIESIK